MAMDEAPPFWWKKAGWQAWLLSPFGYLYGRAAAARMQKTPTTSVNIPVICVGNFVAGGAGKTPTVAMLAEHLIKKNMKPGILSRGHGGAIQVATLVNPEKHNAHDVGAEIDRTCAAIILEYHDLPAIDRLGREPAHAIDDSAFL